MGWLIASLLLGFALRAYQLGHDSLWYDEAGSLHYASQPLVVIGANALADAHPPLYFYLQHFWLSATGSSEYASRYASLLAGLATAPLLYPIGRRIGGHRLGALAVAAWSLSPYGVYYSRELRMYALLALLAALSTYALLRLLDRPTGGRAAWYGLTALTLFYVHYFGPTLLIGHGLLVLMRRNRTALLVWTAAAGLAGALFAPWLFAVAWQLGDFAGGRDGASAWRVVGSTAAAFATGFPPEQVAERRVDDPLMTLGLPLLASALVLLGLRSPPIAALLLGPVAATLLLVVGRAEFTPRYLTVAAPAFTLALAAGLSWLWSLNRVAAAAVGLLLFGLTANALYRQHADPRLWHDDYRSAVQHIAVAEHPDQVVVLTAGYIRPAYAYYARGRWPAVGLPTTYPPDDADTVRRLEQLAGQHRFVWLLLWQEYHADPRNVVESWLAKHGQRVDDRRFRGDVRVIGFALKP